MTIQDSINLLTAQPGWSFEGSFIQVHPTAPASIGGGGGLRERRYRFNFGGQVIHFNTKSVRLKARAIAQRGA